MGSDSTLPAFDLTREPWIPVAALDGSRLRLSLRDTFARAHELRGVEHAIPIMELGAWRLLIAIATDVLAPRDSSELDVALDARSFDVASFEAYFNKWSSRFDLFHSKHPFLQHAGAIGEEKPLAEMSPFVPHGTNTIHWHKRSERAFCACPSCAAAFLTTIAPAMTAGGAGLSPSINGAPPYYCMLNAPTLHQSILLNICTDAPQVLKGGAPAWRSDRPPNANARTTHATLLEAYTWQPRTLRLIPGAPGACAMCGRQADPIVRTMQFSKGDACDFANWRDPNVAYISNKEKTSPLRPREDREPWRDVEALLLLEDKASGSRRTVERPRLVSQFATLRQEGSTAANRMSLRLIGMRTDLKMKVFEWMAEDLALPVPIAPNERLYSTLVRATATADAIGRALGVAITNATRRESFDHRDLARSLTIPAARRYWSALDDAFRECAARISTRDPLGEGLLIEQDEREWNARCVRTARAAFQSAVDRLSRNADQLIATERARAGLDRYLARFASTHATAPGGHAT